MNNNTQQIMKLIDRLTLKTSEGSLQWRSVGASSYEIRVGDFSISIRSTGPRSSLIGGTELTVTRLNGSRVARVTTNENLHSGFTFLQDKLPPEYLDKIDDLFFSVSNRNDDLDEVLRNLE